jgi:hypothetical protein
MELEESYQTSLVFTRACSLMESQVDMEVLLINTPIISKELLHMKSKLEPIQELS